MLGLELMLKSVLQNYLNEHPELLVQAQQIGQFVMTVDARLTRIEAALGIEPEPIKGDDHAQRQ